MARKRKYEEPTDVISVRLPLSLIDWLDNLCTERQVGRGDILVDVLRRYARPPDVRRARITVANLSVALLIIGAGLALAFHFGGGQERWLRPAREGAKQPAMLESSETGTAREVQPPAIPLRDAAADPRYRWGNLQFAIPRERPTSEARAERPAP